MKRRVNNLSREENRKALRAAVAKVVLALLKETQRSQAYAAAAAGISRTTLRNIIDGDRHHGEGRVPAAKLDTLADVACGLNVPLSYVIALLSKELTKSTDKQAPESEGTIEIRFGDRLFQGKVVQLSEPKIGQKNGQPRSGI